MELIVALNLSQHVKHLSEISDVLERGRESIFTPEQLAAWRFRMAPMVQARRAV